MTFADGDIIWTDTAIGCNGGYHSASRPAALGDRFPEHDFATYAGKYCYRAIVPIEDACEILGPMAGDSQVRCLELIVFLNTMYPQMENFRIVLLISKSRAIYCLLLANHTLVGFHRANTRMSMTPTTPAQNCSLEIWHPGRPPPIRCPPLDFLDSFLVGRGAPTN